ncbi:hypothetical protein AB1Y20_000487 [Prymnesium parvum]|uniref:Cation/H+ exchanger transmembrane domain-containing protein n=1 Tax=Prymnesium parvum TaxID=97485 RepID=A0AB34K893_PRYPA|mmetsp:Transcript_25588/g.58555  ORF Transcript_25588/g.58555 Transcript_25588/m.58555 type:complete len:562 (-) Transcript_25588:249-1934(-)
MIGIVALGATFSLSFLLERNHVQWLPESAVAVLMGGFAACVVSLAADNDLMKMMRFDMDFFMNWLIPPIIFEAAFNMNVPAFFANLLPTLIFAFVGTTFSTFVVATIVYVAGQYQWCYALSPLASLTFGSLISATDPVAVLATFQALGVSPNLFSMVFGESVLNDAVAIVLTRTLVSFTHETVSISAVGHACLVFAKIFVGSSTVGLVHGVLGALLFKHLALRDHEETAFLEVVLSFTFPWTAFFMAEACEYSGIVAILFCGIVFATYTRVNVSKEGIALMAGVYKCVAKIAETFVFVYLGMACGRMDDVGLFTGAVWRLSAVAVVACLLGRLHVFVGSRIANCFRDVNSDPPTIEPAEQVVMWLSGLRGGVAFAIAAVSFEHMDFPEQCGGFPREHCGDGDFWEHSQVPNDSTAVLQMTMLVAVFTIFVFGGCMPMIARVCGVVLPQEANRATARTVMDNRPSPLLHSNTPPQLRARVEESHSWFVRFLTHEEDYTSSLKGEQERTHDRFIGRGSVSAFHQYRAERRGGDAHELSSADWEAASYHPPDESWQHEPHTCCR